MSRSTKKPIVKDKGMTNKEYWSRIRRNHKQHLKQNYLDEDLSFKDRRSIVNDYDRCDWVFYLTKYDADCWDYKRQKRK